MNSDKACQANFIQIFALTVALVGSGAVTGEEINCGDNCTATYADNTTVSLTAQPDIEWVFENFSGDCDSQGNLQMSSDKNCIATFVEDANIPNNGDGNVDGIPDTQQNNVVTIPDQVDGEYLTLEVEPTCSIDDSYTDLPSNQGEYDQSYQFPQGLMYFELGCAETDVTVYFHALQRAQNPIMQKYGPTTPGDLTTLGWYTIPDVTYDTVTIDGKSVVTATYHLIDGELGDNTAVDGRIIDPVGLAFSDDFDSIVSFVSNNASASTQLGNVGIPVSRLGSEGTLSIDYTTVNGTAIAGQDYQATSGTLTWGDGDMTPQIVTINLLGNAVIGNTLSLALNNLTASGNAVLALDTLSITITDEVVPVEEIIAVEDEIPVAETAEENTPIEESPVEEEPTNTTTADTTTDSPAGNNLISFTNQGYIANKNEGIATITVNRTGTQGSVSIDYTTINGTATANQDYQSTSGTLTWNLEEDGVKSFDVALLDTATLGNSLILSLGNLSNAEGQFGTDIAVLTILDEIALANLPTTTTDGQTPSTITDSTTGDTATQPTTSDTQTTDAQTTTESPTDTTNTGTTNDPTIVVPTDVLASDVIVEGNAIDEIFNAQGQIFYEDMMVTNRGSVSNARFEANVNNQGLISNSSFGPEAIVTGGRLSGDIVNEGTVDTVNFVGMSLTGGTLSGNVTNTSQIGGIIQDVQLAAGATLTGGKIGGTVKSAPDSTIANVQLTTGTRVSGGTITGEITGDPSNPNNPPVITAANIAPGTVLSNVRISPTVELPANVVLGPGVLLPSEPPTLEDFGYKITEIVALEAENFAQLEPAVFGTFGAEEMAAIPPESFSQTQSEQVSEMNEEGTAAMSTEQFNAMPPAAMGGMTEDNIGGFSPEVMAEMQEEHVEEMEPEAFGGMEQEQLAAIPPDALPAMSSEQMAELPKETLAGLSNEQLAQLPTQALSGLQSENMGGLSTDVLNNFTPEHLSALDAGQFTQMSSQDVSKLFTHFDANKISIQNVAELVPPGWQIDLNTGAITAPEGAKLTPRTFSSASNNVSPSVQLPSMADIEKGIGLGGQGISVKDDMTRSLAEQDLTDFVLSQNEETGILWVEGTGDSEGIKYTFIPDVDNVIQVDGDKIPIGLSVTEGGFYTITTPDEKQYKVVPAPQDPIALSEVLEGGKVVIGKRGEVMMDIPESSTRKPGKPRQVAMFDPFIEPAPDDLCVEIIPGEIVCDFDNAPPSQQPGIQLEANTRAAYKNQQQGRVVFPDGSSQLITPTLLTPDLFAELGFEFEGVEDVVFNANGIFYVSYQGQPYLIVPKFEVITEEVTEEEIAADNDEQPGESSIVVNSDATLTYTVILDAEETNTRKRGEPRQVMQFKPEIQIAPPDLCVEIAPGEIVCDFENGP